MAEDRDRKEQRSERDERFLRALGLITVNFAALEHQIQMHIAALLRHAVKPEDTKEGTFYLRTAQLMTAELQFYKLLTLFDSFYKHVEKNPSRRSKMDELVKRAGGLANKRDTVVHSAWFFAEERNQRLIRTKTTAKKKKNRPINLRSEAQEVQIEELEKLADELWEVGHDIELVFRNR